MQDAQRYVEIYAAEPYLYGVRGNTAPRAINALLHIVALHRKMIERTYTQYEFSDSYWCEDCEELHAPNSNYTVVDTEVNWCNECSVTYPCPTLKAIIKELK